MKKSLKLKSDVIINKTGTTHSGLEGLRYSATQKAEEDFNG